MKQDKEENLSELEAMLTPQRLERIRKVVSQRVSAFALVADRLHHPQNVSAILRSADAFGVQNVHLVGEPCELIQGIAMGSDKWVDVHYHPSAEAAALALRAEGYELAIVEAEYLHTHTHLKSLSPMELPFERKLAVVLGSERAGVSPEFIAQAQYHTFIPMLGFVESLNVSVAASIILYSSLWSEGRRERRVPMMEPEEAEQLYQGWIQRETVIPPKG